MPAPHPKQKVGNLAQNEVFTTLCLPPTSKFYSFWEEKIPNRFWGDVVEIDYLFEKS